MKALENNLYFIHSFHTGVTGILVRPMLRCHTEFTVDLWDIHSETIKVPTEPILLNATIVFTCSITISDQIFYT
jgi:hypothetical protein